MEQRISEVNIPLEHKKKISVILGACLLWFYHALFSFALAVILPSTLEYYGMMDMYAILTGICALLAAIAVPIGGKLGDRFGRRKVCLLVVSLRVAVLTACSIPTNGTIFFIMTCMGRLLGGMMASLCSAIIGDVTDKDERPRWLGLYGGANGAAFLAGLAVTGLIVDNLSGFAAFALYAPFGVVGLILVALFFPNKPSSNPAPIDVTGMTLMTMGMGAVLVWFSFGGKFFSRTSPLGIALIVVGAILLYFFVRVERRVSDPFLDFNLFRMKPFVLCFWVSMMIAPMSQTLSTVLVLYGKNTLGLSSAVTSTLAIPKNIMFALLPPILGAWVAKNRSRFRTTFMGAGLLLMIGCLICATWDDSTPLFLIYLVMIIPGLGTALQNVSINPYVQVTMPRENVGIAAATVTFSNNLGVVLFNVVYNMVYNPRYTAAMEMGGGVHLAQAINEIFRIMCIFSAVCSAVILILTLLIGPAKQKK